MKVIAVMGATGAQGGGVARRLQLQRSGEWQVRAITRNVDSKSAQSLKTEGMEVVAADLDDHASLMKAFQGVHAIYAVTNFWERVGSLGTKGAGEYESKQVINIASAAAHTPTVDHFVLSTLPEASAISNGKAPVPHMDYKARVDDHIKKEFPELAKKTTFMWIAFYGTNLINFPLIKPFEVPMSGGKYIWAQASAPTALMPVTGDISHNVGVFVHAILSHPEKTHGKYMNVRTEIWTMEQILAIWAEVSGKEAVYVQLSFEEYKKLWGVYGEEMAMQFKFGEMAGGDWETWTKVKGLLVQPEDLGIRKEDLMDLKQTFMSMSDSLA